MDTHSSNSTTTWRETQHIIAQSSEDEWQVFWQEYQEVKAKGYESCKSSPTYQNYPVDYTAETHLPFHYAYSDFSASPLTPTTTNSTFGASTPPKYQSSTDSESSTMDPTSPTSDKKDTFQCTFCNKVFGKKHLLNRHLITHTKPITCPECTHTTAKQRDMNRHILAIHPASERGSTLARASKFPCPVGTCNRSQARFAFKRKDHLDRHMRNKHR